MKLANNTGVFLNCYERMSEEERRSIRDRAQRICTVKYSWAAMAGRYMQLAKVTL